MVSVAITAAAAVLAFGYAALLCTVVAKQASEKHPTPRWWAAGAVSAVVAIVATRVADEPDIAVFLGATAALLVVPSWVDVLCKRLPNPMTLHVAVVGLGMFVYTLFTKPDFWGSTGWTIPLIVTGFLVAFVAFSILSKGGMGMGDAKYGPGLLLILFTFTYWVQEPESTVLGVSLLSIYGFLWLFLSFFIATIPALIRLVRGAKASIAFGPALAAGFFVMIPVITYVDTAPILGF